MFVSKQLPRSISSSRPLSVESGAGSTLFDYFSLLKPRVMSLVVFTGAVGLFLAPGTLHPLISFVAILCLATGAGAAGALNMWYEHSIDAVMSRTCRRPIPSKKIHPSDALSFAVFLACGSVFVMGTLVNYWAAFWLAVAILFYFFIYTVWLKPRTAYNIVIGGAAGALPPVIGWSSVTGAVSGEAWVLFGIIFLWTPAHFWSLALIRADEYQQAGLPMLPVCEGERKTRRQIGLYTCLTVLFSFLPFLSGFLGTFYALCAGIFGIFFVFLSGQLWFSFSPQKALHFFFFSIFYLFFLFLSMVGSCLFTC